MNVANKTKIEIKRPNCPICKENVNIVKSGINISSKFGKEQRWYCNNCKENWTEPNKERIVENYNKLVKVIFNGRDNNQGKGGLNFRSSGSEKHSSLKLLAIKFLESNGFTEITTEYKLSIDGKYTMLDVAGFKNGYIAAVECGVLDKEQIFWNFFLENNNHKLYWLPYNSKHILTILPVKQL